MRVQWRQRLAGLYQTADLAHRMRVAAGRVGIEFGLSKRFAQGRDDRCLGGFLFQRNLVPAQRSEKLTEALARFYPAAGELQEALCVGLSHLVRGVFSAAGLGARPTGPFEFDKAALPVANHNKIRAPRKDAHTMSFNLLPCPGAFVANMQSYCARAEADFAQIVGDLQMHRALARQRPALSARPRSFGRAATPRDDSGRISTRPGRAGHGSTHDAFTSSGLQMPASRIKAPQVSSRAGRPTVSCSTTQAANNSASVALMFDQWSEAFA